MGEEQVVNRTKPKILWSYWLLQNRY